MSFFERNGSAMKVKVDKLTYKEFSEYTDSTFAKPIKMSLAFFVGIAVILIIVAMNKPEMKGALTPLYWCVGILLFLLISSNASVSMAFKKSGFDSTNYSFVFTDEGMKIAMGKLKGDLEWKYVRYIKETKNLWIMRVPNSQFIMPKRCMKEDEFEELIKNCLPEEKIKRMKYKKNAERITDDGDN